MATRGGRKRTVAARKTEKDEDKGSNTGRRTKKTDTGDAETTPVKQKRLGVTSRVRPEPSRTSPRLPGKGKSSAGVAKGSPSTSKSSPAPARGRPRKTKTVEQRDDSSVNTKNKSKLTASQELRALKSKVKDILKTDPEMKARFEAESGGTAKDNDLLSKDSDDDVSETEQQEVLNNSQLTMDPNKDYHRHPLFDGDDMQEDEDLIGNNVDGDYVPLSEQEVQGNLDQSGVSMVPDEVNYDDPDKGMEEWWDEDPTREVTLCSMWHKEKSLYDMTAYGYRVTGCRDVILRKFATVLLVPPHVIHTRMTSLRNMYQKFAKAAPSGSAPVGSTPRQREVCRLLNFLHQHVKTVDSINNYKGKSPAKPVYTYQRKAVPAAKTSQKKIPAAAGSAAQLPDRHQILPTDEDGNIMFNDLSPIQRHGSPTQSESGSQSRELPDIEDESVNSEPLINKKHFSRNQRLHDPYIRQVSAQNSVRLSTPMRKSASTQLFTSYGSSSCKDTAPRAQSRAVDPTETKTVQHKRSEVSSLKNKRVLGTVIISESPEKEETALERYSRLQGISCDDAVQVVPLPKKVTATSRKGRPPGSLNKSQKDKLGVASTSMADGSDTSTMSEDIKKYGVEINPEWYEKQGSDYRKLKEAELARKKKEKAESDPMVGIMQEKSDSIRKMADAFAKPEAVTSASSSNSPEQLFADSLVPQMRRMSQTTRDSFMCHVLQLAFKGIAGTWPEK